MVPTKAQAVIARKLLTVVGCPDAQMDIIEVLMGTVNESP
jgi:hypothetical protein